MCYSTEQISNVFEIMGARFLLIGDGSYKYRKGENRMDLVVLNWNSSFQWTSMVFKMDGWIEGWMDGWMFERMDGWMGWWMVG